MISRRRFLHSTIAATLFARSFSSLAQSYDMIVRGGRVIDPSLHLDAVADVAITNGRIAAIQPRIDTAGSEEIDARGKLVMPGLIDVHGHYARDAQGGHICLSDGVTGWVDAGSAGADNIEEILANVRSAPQPARILINIGRRGVIDDGDTADMSLANVEAARAAIAAHLDYVVGVKARLTDGVTANDREVIRRAQEAASYFKLPVMVHMGQSATSMAELIQVLKPGDIVTHMFAPPPSPIIDDRGRILPEILEARRRGIRFDVANGRIDHLRWDTFDTIMGAGFWPDTVSTDGFSNSRNVPGVVDLPNIMSKFLNFGGMGLMDVVATATLNAARYFPFIHDAGTLNVGAPADIAILELRQGSFEFLDNYENVRVGTQRLFPFETLLAGRRVPRV
ncbi:MAG: amidohydrolase family protein [Gammaproteobacteria bacterium]|nr:amidohydrolase family protein [Pseudomonadales bacterium]MCP5345891.1 amidohydrolase family protein [Pseudomonadales bacterium]